MTELASGLAAVAGAQYRSGGLDPSVQLMLSADPARYLEQVSSLDRAAGLQADTLRALRAQQRLLDQRRQEAATVLQELDGQTKALEDSKRQVQAKLAEAQGLLATLTAAERAAIMRQEDDGSASRGSSRVDLSSLPPADGYAATAVAAALSKQGADYEWGAEGPGTFDCSGLMVWAYAKAGVSLPRTSQEQATVGANVGTDWHNAQPGDLVIYKSDRGHVGMYIGNGQVVHAPRAGETVRVMRVDAISINIIRRP